MPDQYQTIQVPGEGNVQFPVSMSDADISKALQSHFAQKAGTDPATLKSYAQQWYGGDIQKASVAYAKASQGGQEPGIGDTLKQGLENAKAFGQGVVDLGKGAWQQAKDIINPPPAAEAKHNAQHALDSVDPDVLINWIKDKYDKGGLSPQDQKDLFRGMGTLGAQALVAKAGDTAIKNPEAVSSAVDTAKTGLANAADVTGTVVKGAAQGIAEGHKGAAKLAVPMVATIASSIPEVGHYVGPAIEGLYDAHNAVKGIKGALAERAAAKLKAALDAAQEAAIEAHRAANPPQPYDPSYSSAPPVAGPVEAIPATATPTGRAPGKFSEAEPLPPRAPLNPNLQATPPTPLPPVEPIASDLPSGKRVPTAEERVARASTEIAQPSPAATPNTALLDSVAKGQTGKLFKNLTGPQQEIVKKLAAQVAEPSASPGTTTSEERRGGARTEPSASPAQAPPATETPSTPSETIAAKKTGSETPINAAAAAKQPEGKVFTIKPSEIPGAGKPKGDFEWDDTDKKTIDDYTQRLKEGEKPPPVLLQVKDGKLQIQDGFHRLAAAKEAGDVPIDATVGKQAPQYETPTETIAGKKANTDLQEHYEPTGRATNNLRVPTPDELGRGVYSGKGPSPSDSTVTHIAGQNEKAFNVAHYLFEKGIKDPSIIDKILDSDKVSREDNKAFMNADVLEHGRKVGNAVPVIQYRTGLNGETRELAKAHLQRMVDNETAGKPPVETIPSKAATGEGDLTTNLQRSIQDLQKKKQPAPAETVKTPTR